MRCAASNYLAPSGKGNKRCFATCASSSEIDFDDALVVLHVIDRAFGEDAALVQHGDARAEAAHEGHVMLDDDDGVLARQSEDEGGGLLGLAVGHAGDRLVEQEELLVLHQQ